MPLFTELPRAKGFSETRNLWRHERRVGAVRPQSALVVNASPTLVLRTPGTPKLSSFGFSKQFQSVYSRKLGFRHSPFLGN